MDCLSKAGDANAFITDPKPTKEMYDVVQDMHPKTLSGCFIIETYTKCNADILYRDMVEVVMKSGHPRAPLNLKVLPYHRNRVGAGEALPLGNKTGFLTAICHFSHRGSTTPFRRSIMPYNARA